MSLFANLIAKLNIVAQIESFWDIRYEKSEKWQIDLYLEPKTAEAMDLGSSTVACTKS